MPSVEPSTGKQANICALRFRPDSQSLARHKEVVASAVEDRRAGPVALLPEAKDIFLPANVRARFSIDDPELFVLSTRFSFVSLPNKCLSAERALLYPLHPSRKTRLMPTRKASSGWLDSWLASPLRLLLPWKPTDLGSALLDEDPAIMSGIFG